MNLGTISAVLDHMKAVTEWTMSCRMNLHVRYLARLDSALLDLERVRELKSRKMVKRILFFFEELALADVCDLVWYGAISSPLFKAGEVRHLLANASFATADDDCMQVFKLMAADDRWEMTCVERGSSPPLLW